MEKVVNYLKRNLHLLIVGVVALTGLVLAISFDFSFSRVLYDPKDPGNAFEIIVAGFAEFPCYLFCVFGGIGLIVTMPKDKKSKVVFSWIIGLLAILVATGLGAKTAGEYVVKGFECVKGYEKALQIPAIALVIVCAGLVVLFTYLKRDKFNKKQFFKVSIMMIILAATYVIISNAVKYSISRPRPYFVFASENPLEVFRPWYIPDFLGAVKGGDTVKSFPSGHTGAAMAVAGFLPLFFSLFKTTNSKRFEIIGVYSGLLFAIIVAFGRIMCGAHFLGDVSMGSLLVVIEIIVIKEVMPIIFKKFGVKDE